MRLEVRAYQIRLLFLVVASLTVAAVSGHPMTISSTDTFLGVDLDKSRPIELPATDIEMAARALEVVDLNGDGVDDLVILRSATNGTSELVVRLGNPAVVYPRFPQFANLADELEPFANTVGPFEVSARAHRLLAVDVNLDSRPDVVVLDDVSQPIGWLPSRRAGGQSATGRGSSVIQPWPRYPFPHARHLAEKITMSAEDPEDIVEMRLGAHAGSDIAMVAPDGTVRFLPKALGGIFIVNSPENLGDSFDNDGFCDTENNPTTDPPTPPSGVCTLRAAIEQSNFNAGADTIRFAIGGSTPITIMVGGAPLEITDPLTLDATSQAGFAGQPIINLEFDGGGLFPGLSVMAGPTLIRGFVIGGFSTEGIAIFADDVTVETCFIGTDATGDTANPNLRGIGVSGDRSRIGGTAVGAGNVISGNTSGGIFLGGGDHVFRGNTVGTNAAGTMDLGNGLLGVGMLLTGSDSLVIDNLVSGHSSIGIRIEGNRNTLQTNRIGTDRTGTLAIPNFFAGIYVVGVDEALIGGIFNPLSSNLVSGNDGDGIRVAGSTRVDVFGNMVGADSTGQLPLGNTFNGIHIEAAASTASSLINVGGGATFLGFLGNLVSANGAQGWHGIFVEGNAFQVNVEGNRVGTNLTGTAALGNVVDGIRVQESRDNDIGTDSGSPITFPNLVAYNGGAGIAIVDEDASAGNQNSNGNRITVNRLFDNGGLGIDLTLGSTILDGVTPNDVGDTDFGPNQLQNFPLISTLSEPTPGTTRIEGTLSSRPNLPYDIRLFTNTSCDPSGFGEAKDHVTTLRVMTNGAGEASFLYDSMTQVNVVTATATNVETDDTSELSPCGTSTAGRLGNRVWEDLDNDGLQGVDDPGIAGIIVNLWNSTATTLLDTTVTDAAGFYGFDDLASGSYRVGIVPAIGFTETLVDEGIDDTIDSDIDDAFLTAAFSYTAGSVDLTRDAGLTSLIFADGFESGSVTAWSSSFGAP